MFNHGDMRRDFTYVDSTCAVLAAAVHRQVQSPDPINLAFGTNTTLLALIERLEAALGHSLEVEHVASRVGDVRASQSDGIRIRELFPELQPHSLDDGLANTIEWFKTA